MIELNPESEQTFGVHIMCKVLIELLPREDKPSVVANRATISLGPPILGGEPFYSSSSKLEEGNHLWWRSVS